MTEESPATVPEKWPEKAYKNLGFLNSAAGREIRVLCEFVEPRSRLAKLNVRDTVVFFGSARTPPRAEAEKRLRELDQENAPEEELQRKRASAERDLHMSKYYEDAADLAERLTRWSKSLEHPQHRFIVCSGGGPGIMAAANLGASRAKGRTMGLNISLPMEQFPNPHQTRELSFEFHYFFVRKFWFFYLAKALIVFPGGFGTMDELFEVLTLIQTEKAKKKMPVVIYGSEYWKKLINFDAMVEWGVISQEDLDLFRFCDTVDEAFEYVSQQLTCLHLDTAEDGQSAP